VGNINGVVLGAHKVKGWEFEVENIIEISSIDFSTKSAVE